ncbi:MAG: ATP-binding protein [candidate division Zixibacteria bacterium]|nr:ATP-binding protein [candidate division Zixibacteria bacterium]MDH3937095.1 ATP-binding protein [candidate division Zixibacteria bacterium]MDH4034004.1 ATP-binding protein [candidate division Zixibacteria bacterium]
MNLPSMISRCKLRTKFVAPISVILVCSIFVMSAYLIQRQEDGFRLGLEKNGETMVRILALQAESGVLFEDTQELDELLDKFSVFEDIRCATIYNLEGEILSQLGQWDVDSAIRLREISHPNDPDAAYCHDYYVEDATGKVYIEMNYPVMSRVEKLDRENLGITGGIDRSLTKTFVREHLGDIKLVLSLEAVNEAIAEARVAAIILTLLVVAITILFITFIVRFVTKPVQMLVDVTDQVARGDLSQRVSVNQSDELGQLANTFNKMIESLQQTRNEIEEYNRTLEEKIIQRTLELEDAQAQLIQSEKMSAIGQLAAGVAHELNNPLGGILGYAQFALEKMKKKKTADPDNKEMMSFIRYLTDIETQARRCKAIVQNLLRFSRSRRATEFEDVDINATIEDTVTFVEHQLHMNQIELSLELDSNLPIIQGSGGQLQQVFTNLIINAMHASKPQGVISIKSRFSPALGEFGGAVEVQIADQGSGIEPETIKKIFEPFFTTKEVGKGTGLGLSVSYGIIKDHGGEIKVDSVVSRGTKFTLILPVQKPASASDNSSETVPKQSDVQV